MFFQVTLLLTGYKHLIEPFRKHFYCLKIKAINHFYKQFGIHPVLTLHFNCFIIGQFKTIIKVSSCLSVLLLFPNNIFLKVLLEIYFSLLHNTIL